MGPLALFLSIQTINNKAMAIETFQSRYGYQVTRARLCGVPKVTAGAGDGYRSQEIITFETASNGDTVAVTMWSQMISVDPDGNDSRHSHLVGACAWKGGAQSYSKAKARELYRKALKDGLSPDIERI